MVLKGKEEPLLNEHYSYDGTLKTIIDGKNSATNCATLIEEKLISQLDHAAYLFRELAKAELLLILDSKYNQDQAQGQMI